MKINKYSIPIDDLLGNPHRFGINAWLYDRYFTSCLCGCFFCFCFSDSRIASLLCHRNDFFFRLRHRSSPGITDNSSFYTANLYSIPFLLMKPVYRKAAVWADSALHRSSTSWTIHVFPSFLCYLVSFPNGTETSAAVFMLFSVLVENRTTLSCIPSASLSVQSSHWARTVWTASSMPSGGYL